MKPRVRFAPSPTGGLRIGGKQAGSSSKGTLTRSECLFFV